MPATRAAREESWNSIHQSDASQDSFGVAAMDSQELPRFGQTTERLSNHPLSTTSRRVGKEVEDFARTLDKFGPRREQAATDAREVLPLIHNYERIASDAVKRLKKNHEPESLERMRRSGKRNMEAGNTSRPEGDAETPDTSDDLVHWENERQTWQILRLMLQVRLPVPEDVPDMPILEERYKRPNHTPKLHQLSSQLDVWKSFLESNNDMYEKHVVVEWLKESANNLSESVDTVVEKSGIFGQAGWVLPLLYSKGTIKNTKRLRSWPQPIDLDAPGVDNLIVKESGEPLVTQLDPDAITRQGRHLEKEDAELERVMWLACYTMIRRGHSWKTIQEWCKDRSDNWRALSLRGDPRYLDGSQSKDVLSGWQARSIWRRMCSAAAQSGSIDDYENAAYGILSGDLASVLQVSNSWEDYLFASFNSQILQGFDLFTKKTFANSLPWEVLDKLGGAPTGLATSSADVVNESAQVQGSKGQALSPYEIMQGAIISDTMQRLLDNQGIAFLQQTQNQVSRATGRTRSTTGPTADLSTQDFDLLRMFTHLMLILRAILPWKNTMIPIEHIVISYVDYLGQSGRQQLIPMYASLLSDDGAVECMASQLPTISDIDEKKTIMKLMNEYSMDVSRILSVQLSRVVENKLLPPTNTNLPPVRILVSPHKRNLLPPIKPNFMHSGYGITDEDLDLINGMEWYLLANGMWDETIGAGGYIYKYFLRKGAVSAAKELAGRVSLSVISETKTKDLLGKSIDLATPMDETTYEELVHNHPSYHIDYLVETSTTFRDLEQLVLALDAIDVWGEAANILGTDQDPRHNSEGKKHLKACLGAVDKAISPILTSNWLCNPADDKENVELGAIRRQYLPELIIAYNTILAVSAQYLSRESLIQAMDLTAVVAAPEAGLFSVFVESGRMAELVDVFAMTSRTLLRADEIGLAKRGKRGTSNEKLGIWTPRREQIIKNLQESSEKNIQVEQQT